MMTWTKLCGRRKKPSRTSGAYCACEAVEQTNERVRSTYVRLFNVHVHVHVCYFNPIAWNMMGRPYSSHTTAAAISAELRGALAAAINAIAYQANIHSAKMSIRLSNAITPALRWEVCMKRSTPNEASFMGSISAPERSLSDMATFMAICC